MSESTKDRVCTGFYAGYDLEGGSSYRRPCWRHCGCGLLGCPSSVLAPSCPSRAPASDSTMLVHILSQEDQPYGSERRCCNHCGVMIWGALAPLHVDNWTDWLVHPNRCALERKTAA